MKRLFFFILGLMLIFNASAQTDTTVRSTDKLFSNTHYFGLSAGLTSGFGLSYIYWPKTFGFQVTALPIYKDDEFFYSAGLTFLQELSKSKRTRLYLYLGNQITNIEPFDNDFNYNIGIGPGIEQGSDSFKFHLRIGYALYLNHNKSYYSESTTNDFSLLPTLELGWFYNFGKEK
jgi:hypothetical protein